MTRSNPNRAGARGRPHTASLMHDHFARGRLNLYQFGLLHLSGTMSRHNAGFTDLADRNGSIATSDCRHRLQPNRGDRRELRFGCHPAAFGYHNADDDRMAGWTDAVPRPRTALSPGGYRHRRIGDAQSQGTIPNRPQLRAPDCIHSRTGLASDADRDPRALTLRLGANVDHAAVRRQHRVN